MVESGVPVEDIKLETPYTEFKPYSVYDMFVYWSGCDVSNREMSICLAKAGMPEAEFWSPEECAKIWPSLKDNPQALGWAISIPEAQQVVEDKTVLQRITESIWDPVALAVRRACDFIRADAAMFFVALAVVTPLAFRYFGKKDDEKAFAQSEALFKH